MLAQKFRSNNFLNILSNICLYCKQIWHLLPVFHYILLHDCWSHSLLSDWNSVTHKSDNTTKVLYYDRLGAVGKGAEQVKLNNTLQGRYCIESSLTSLCAFSTWNRLALRNLRRNASSVLCGTTSPRSVSTRLRRVTVSINIRNKKVWWWWWWWWLWDINPNLCQLQR